MKAVCVLVLLLATELFAADAPPNKTFGLDNGRLWNTLTPVMRQAYVAGIRQGWQLRGFTEDIVEARVLHFFTDDQFTTNDVAEAVSSVYNDGENLSLPIGWVVLASLAVEHGENDRNTVLVALRKRASQLRKGADRRLGTEFIPIDVILGTKKNERSSAERIRELPDQVREDAQAQR